jgi:hypothetical protein
LRDRGSRDAVHQPSWGAAERVSINGYTTPSKNLPISSRRVILAAFTHLCYDAFRSGVPVENYETDLETASEGKQREGFVGGALRDDEAEW